MTEQTLIQGLVVLGLLLMVYSIPFIVGDKEVKKDNHAH